MGWTYGKTLSRYGVSYRIGDITPQLTEIVEYMNLYENFLVRPGTINICLKKDLCSFNWDVEIPKCHWQATGACCGAKLRKCTLSCKNEEGEWEDSVAYLYDPDNSGDSYLHNLRKWEVLAEKEFSWLRCRGEKQFDVRIKLSSNEF